MPFSKFSIAFLSIMFMFLSSFSLAFSYEIPGYIGNQSFRLDDDSQLSDLNHRVEDLKNDVTRIEQSKSQFEDQMRSLENDKQRTNSKIDNNHREADSLRTLKTSEESKLAELKQAPEANAAQISALNSQIASTDRAISENSRQESALKSEQANISTRLDQINRDYSDVVRRYQDIKNRYDSEERSRDSYRDELISAIQFINRQGANNGQTNGSDDGYSLARRLGQDIGVRDGEADGFNSGTIAGQDRYYQRGAEQGERDGSARARLNGERDGTDEGTRAGNSSAGNREGEIDGIKRAEASDAAAVGIAQGKKAGMERAVRTGSSKGQAIGEKETVSKFESGDLNAININGPFAGSFQRRSPDYPGDFNGPTFNPNVYNSKSVLKAAYSDGYLYNYRQYTRYEYLRRIDGEYNVVYDNAYARTYDQASNREYPDYYNRGRYEADARAYSRDYPIVKAQAFKIAFDQTNNSPIRSSEEYRASYASAELVAYKDKYEEIRKANYDQLELEIFNANIQEQTEIYRQKRIGEVSNIYDNNAILAFVNSEMFDGGINGVAGFDGVYQPGETTLHTLTLKNFGLKAAQNVSVQLDNGTIVKLPEIPARSLVVIKGAGASKIGSTATIGSTAKLSLKVISQLTSNDRVEGLHFDNIDGGVLKSSDQKSVRVAYPLALSGLALNAQLLKGVKNKLSISVTNNSKRLYTGEMKVQVLANSQSGIITKDFSSLTSVQNTAQISDAEVLVNDEKDIYRDLSFSAKISLNGVTLGVLGADYIAMAKAQYADKGKAPVLVANSDKNLKALLDALSLAGGTEKISVLDLSLSSLNAGILSGGLNQKVLLIADDEKGTNIKSLNTFVTKSKDSSFLFIDESNSGLKYAVSLKASTDAQYAYFDKKVLYFTNPHRAEGVTKSSAMIQSSLQSFDKDLELGQNLTFTAPELLAKFKSEINRNTFFTPNNYIKIFSLKALAEVLSINNAYDKSGSIFSRDKKWAEMIVNDTSLFINVLKSASKGDVTETKLSTVLPAIAMKDTVSNAMSNADGISKVMMMKITHATNNVLGDMEDGFKKSLKNFNKDLYKRAYESAPIHRPFYIKPAPVDNPIPH